MIVQLIDMRKEGSQHDHITLAILVLIVLPMAVGMILLATQRCLQPFRENSLHFPPSDWTSKTSTFAFSLRCNPSSIATTLIQARISSYMVHKHKMHKLSATADEKSCKRPSVSYASSASKKTAHNKASRASKSFFTLTRLMQVTSVWMPDMKRAHA